MALQPNFRQELLDKYKKLVLILEKSRQYREILDEYKVLKENINRKLFTTNSAYCKDCELYIDKSTGKIIQLGEFDLNNNLELKNMFNRLSELYIKQQTFGWKDDMAHCIEVILVSGKVRDIEKQIIAELGKDDGQQIINEIQFEVAKFEKSIGVEIYTHEVNKIIALNKLKNLHSVSSNLTITENNNVIEECITLENANNERFDFRKTGQYKYNDINYFELELLTNLEHAREYNFYIYRIEEINNIQNFIMEESDEIFYKVSDLIEIFKTQNEIQKNKKAKE